MSTIPRTQRKRLAFFESHLANWKARAEALGLEGEPVDELQRLITDTRAAFTTRNRAQAAARAATEILNLTDTKMARKGAEILKKIQFHARDTKNPNVYALARIPSPRKPSPVPSPGKPDDLSVALTAGGALALSWRCRNPANADGTMYEIRRQVESGASVYLATVGQRKYTDKTIPAGSSRLVYTLTAIRSTRRGPEAQFPVKFGSVSAAAAGKGTDGPRLKVA